MPEGIVCMSKDSILQLCLEQNPASSTPRASASEQTITYHCYQVAPTVPEISPLAGNAARTTVATRLPYHVPLGEGSRLALYSAFFGWGSHMHD